MRVTIKYTEKENQTNILTKKKRKLREEDTPFTT